MTLNKPLSAPIKKDPEKPEWEQVIDLFRRNGLEPPHYKLRDEIVVLMTWAWYGHARSERDENNKAYWLDKVDL